MKKVISLIITAIMLLTAVEAGAVGITWSEDTLSEGSLTATVTGIEDGDRVAVATYTGGVFSNFNMAWSEGESASVPVEVKNGDDTARAFVWNQSGMMPKISDSRITKNGIKDDNVIFSDNQKINNAAAVGYRTFSPLSGDYSVSFDLTVRVKGDNAIMLGDSTNGETGYGESSAILQFTGDSFTTRRGNGDGTYAEAAVSICTFETDKMYRVTIQGNTTTNTFNVIINDGENEHISDTMNARTNATAAGIDTIAFVNNGKNTVNNNGYYSNFNFFGTNLKVENKKTVEIPHYTYEGFEGLYYGMEIVSTGKYIRGNNGRLTADYTAVTNDSAKFIPRNMGNGCHAFVCKSSNNRMTTTGTSGETLTSAAYVMTDNTQHWVLEESENYSEDNKTYYLKHIESGNYVGLSGTNLALVTGASKKEIRFVPLEDDSLLYRVAKTDAYNLLTSAQRERFESVYESVAGDVFGRYGGHSEWTPRIRMDNLFTEILSGRLTQAEQVSKLKAFLSAEDGFIYSGQASYQAISSSIPGTAGVYCETDAGVAGTYDFWRGTMLEGVRYKLKIYSSSGSLEQTIDLYVQNDGIAQTNANTFKNIIVQIPYIYRKHLTTIKSRSDSANSYNGGGGVIYIRLNWSPNAGDMKSTIVHELGHVNDQACGNWSTGAGWANAIAKDMFTPSTYGATNSTEDFAEFCRMYFSCYGNADLQRGLQVIMPERYASFGRMRKNNFGGWGLWEDEYTN